MQSACIAYDVGILRNTKKLSSLRTRNKLPAQCICVYPVVECLNAGFGPGWQAGSDFISHGVRDAMQQQTLSEMVRKKTAGAAYVIAEAVMNADHR